MDQFPLQREITLTSEHRTTRIQGYDLARALAVFGMVIVNFRVVMAYDAVEPIWLAWLIGLLEGRAAATFVILAGVGLSLLSSKARLAGDSKALVKNRNSLIKRAVFLFAVGLLYIPIWPADILHFYGVYITFGAFLLASSDRRLWITAGLFILVSIVFMLSFNYEAGWNWDTLSYLDFWSLQGMLRHLFFNGFHPVFPWAAFLFIGMWLGRQSVQTPRIRKRILLLSLAILVAAETISWFLIWSFNSNSGDAEIVKAFFGTQPMPPSSLYMLSAGSVAVVIITLCIAFSDHFRTRNWIKPFIYTGQLALTIYVAHVVIGMGFLELLGILENQSLPLAFITAIIFIIAAVIFSFFWRERFKRGPLEWVMRKVTG